MHAPLILALPFLMAEGSVTPAVPTADEAPDGEELRKMSDDEILNHLGGAMAQQADLIRPVGAG